MLRIDRMTPDDWHRVRAVRLRALDDAPDAFWVTLDEEAATTEAVWRQRLGRPDAVTFVANGDGVDVGLAVGARHHTHDYDGVEPTRRHTHEHDAGLYAMWVAPEARRAGVATALIERVVAWARAAGYTRLRLDVGDTNQAAVRLYEAMGLEPTGHTEAFPPPRQHVTEHERALNLTD
jgi:GNAT superfamily N-acetyltransferase